MNIFKVIKSKVMIAYVMSGSKKELIKVNNQLLEINNLKIETDNKINLLIEELKNIKTLISERKYEAKSEIMDELEYLDSEIDVLNIAKKDLYEAEEKYLESALVLIRNFDKLKEFIYTKNPNILDTIGFRKFDSYYIESNKTNIYEQLNETINEKIKYIDIFTI